MNVLLDNVFEESPRPYRPPPPAGGLVFVAGKQFPAAAVRPNTAMASSSTRSGSSPSYPSASRSLEGLSEEAEDGEQGRERDHSGSASTASRESSASPMRPPPPSSLAYKHRGSWHNTGKESKFRKWTRRLSEGLWRIGVDSTNSPSPSPREEAKRLDNGAGGGTTAVPSGLSCVGSEAGVAMPTTSILSTSPSIANRAFGSTGVLYNQGRRFSSSAATFGSAFGRLETYQKLEALGEGSYATVYKGISNINGHVVALKEIRLNPEEGTPFTAIREASLLKGLKHSNIVTLHDIIHTANNLTFVFEYVHTDLNHYMEKHPGPLDPHNVKLFLFQLLRGLHFCHQRKILHRDLKPQNLLISEGGELKLADFGLARAKSVPTHTYSHEVVTLWYRPPDVLLGSTDYSTPLDMWGVGCIFVEMLMGKPLFPGIKGIYDQLNKIWMVLGTPSEATWPGITCYEHYKPYHFRNCASRSLEDVFPQLSSVHKAGSLAGQILQLLPSKRLSAAAALEHDYFSSLPQAVFSISDCTSIFLVPGVTFNS